MYPQTQNLGNSVQYQQPRYNSPANLLRNQAPQNFGGNRLQSPGQPYPYGSPIRNISQPYLNQQRSQPTIQQGAVRNIPQIVISPPREMPLPSQYTPPRPAPPVDQNTQMQQLYQNLRKENQGLKDKLAGATLELNDLKDQLDRLGSNQGQPQIESQYVPYDKSG